MNVKNVLPFAFAWEIGGPSMDRKTVVSTEVCIQRYFHTTLPQLMRSDVVLILSHIYQRQLTYKSGVITPRGSKISEVPLAERLDRMTVNDFKAYAPLRI